MKQEQVNAYFGAEAVVNHYAKASVNVGLWVSEEKVFTRVFEAGEALLDLGCGAGRISFGLWELGYRKLAGVDVSRQMVKRARALNKLLEAGCVFQVGDATALKFDDGAFDGVIFGFNGLMQIPQRERRRQALREIHRVTRAGGRFVFTAHDRDAAKYADFWQEETVRWEHGEENPELDDFGDRMEKAPEGVHFMHVPTREEIMADLAETGWSVEADALRSQLANEPREVREFSDDTRFWVARKS